MTKPIELYYWPTPNGWKISIALEEMGLPYEVNLIDIGAGDQFKSEFLNISPNNRIPAIVDPDGPEGAPISVFESGAILQYLARKTGLYHGQNERDKVAVDQWLMWQMGGVGPMAGQAHHFLKYAPAMTPPNDLPYAKNRYRDETGRLYGILNRQLERHEFVAGDFFSIADMALWPWVSLWRGQQQILDDKPNLDRWLQAVKARPAVQAGRAVAAARRSNLQTDKKAQELLFKQR
ncbi:MAG: glutathione S-transferase family protein [Rhodobacteraceae bacterium]|nr:glutathione S-transferase N-terminal domain-containing protein [Paracoccaceae bacterium]RZO39628.1 MAG: glutathione S-transferase family protein [Paracoccaceae bacterium]